MVAAGALGNFGASEVYLPAFLYGFLAVSGLQLDSLWTVPTAAVSEAMTLTTSMLCR